MLKHHEISSSKSVIYCWIPSHIGIYGNEKVDKSAKESLNLEVTDFKIPFNNFKPFINKYVCDKWQTLWDDTPFNKLKEIEPIVNHHRLVPKLSRREEIILARLRICHTRITHSCLLKREERPYCIGCDTPFTVRHFLLDCADFIVLTVIHYWPFQGSGSDVVSVSCFGVRFSVMFHFMFVHYTFSSVWVAEWPPFGK